MLVHLKRKYIYFWHFLFTIKPSFFFVLLSISVKTNLSSHIELQIKISH